MADFLRVDIHGQNRMKNPMIGIDSFSFHRFFGWVTQWEKPVEESWSIAQFIDVAAELNVQSVSIQIAHLPDLGEKTLLDLISHLEKNDLHATLSWYHLEGLHAGLFGSKSKENVESVMHAIKASRKIGSYLLRVACGFQNHFSIPAAKRIESLVPKLRYIADMAPDMTIAIENHADFRMTDLVTLINECDRSNVGICFDSGNAIRVGDDVDIAADDAGDLINMVHLKDIAVQKNSIGNPDAWWPSVPYGKGDINISSLLDKFVSLPEIPPIFIELANLHPDWPVEQDVVKQCVNFINNHMKHLEEGKISSG